MKKGLKNGFRPVAEAQKWHFSGAKVMQKDVKSRTVGTQVWDF